MVRVIFKDGSICHYDFVKRYEKENKIALFDLENDCIDYNSLSEIKEIEKEVKNLTLREVAKLGLNISERFTGSPRHTVFDLYDKEFDYSYYDYVDITNLIEEDEDEDDD